MPISFSANTVSASEAEYLQGVSSNIQTQLNGKLSTSATAANSSKLDGRTLFVQSSAPTTGMANGDIWIKTA